MTKKPPHPSFVRLMRLAKMATESTAAPVANDADLARLMNVSSQTMGNWKKRGVSKEGADAAEQVFSCSSTFILFGDVAQTDDVRKGFTNVRLASKTTTPGLVYGWNEVIKMFRDGIEGALPDVFSVEVGDDSLSGRARRGDVVTLCRSKAETVEGGDGVLVRTSNGAYMLRIYKPKGDGTFMAEATNPAFLPLHSEQDGLTVLAVVTGVPFCRWSA